MYFMVLWKQVSTCFSLNFESFALNVYLKHLKQNSKQKHTNWTFRMCNIVYISGNWINDFYTTS